MENWGLITYRETALLYNDGNAAAHKRAAIVIAHELAHMWFGNLVTCAWWEATWLNEGFAQYFEHVDYHSHLFYALRFCGSFKMLHIHDLKVSALVEILVTKVPAAEHMPVQGGLRCCAQYSTKAELRSSK
ncbi:Uncharacterized protein GBIM_01199 [Gryllus bimaculatus]|nr:Uncharacterized protein GBIM_01199 [Gryllus bimaculatus]